MDKITGLIDMCTASAEAIFKNCKSGSGSITPKMLDQLLLSVRYVSAAVNEFAGQHEYSLVQKKNLLDFVDLMKSFAGAVAKGSQGSLYAGVHSADFLSVDKRTTSPSPAFAIPYRRFENVVFVNMLEECATLARGMSQACVGCRLSKLREPGRATFGKLTEDLKKVFRQITTDDEQFSKQLFVDILKNYEDVRCLENSMEQLEHFLLWKKFKNCYLACAIGLSIASYLKVEIAVPEEDCPRHKEMMQELCKVISVLREQTKADFEDWKIAAEKWKQDRREPCTGRLATASAGGRPSPVLLMGSGDDKGVKEEPGGASVNPDFSVSTDQLLMDITIGEIDRCFAAKEVMDMLTEEVCKEAPVHYEEVVVVEGHVSMEDPMAEVPEGERHPEDIAEALEEARGEDVEQSEEQRSGDDGDLGKSLEDFIVDDGDESAEGFSKPITSTPLPHKKTLKRVVNPDTDEEEGGQTPVKKKLYF